jgi:phosphohistidine phosphatase
MKTVYIVRHAKSSWENPLLPDDQRPLLEKGKKRTKKIIDFLLRQDVSVDLMISSHAVRALETAKILAHALRYPKENIRIDSRIYSTDGNGLFDEFNDLPEKSSSVMIIGHNPALTDFVNSFLDAKIDHLPTSGVFSITFRTERWEEVSNSEFTINFLIFPKILNPND